MNYQSILHGIGDTWAIYPPALEGLAIGIEAIADGWRPASHETSALNAARRQPTERTGQVGVLPIVGTVTPRRTLLSDYGLGVAADELGRQFNDMVLRNDVSAILLDVDSPGGSVSGIPELAEKIRSARGLKPITAIANASTYSAAYWIATAADEMVITPSGSLGSIGVVARHMDYSEQNKQRGVMPTYVTSSPYKTEGNFDAPLEDEARAEIQRHVDSYHDMFIGAVAKQRGVVRAIVSHSFGQGRIVGAQEAVQRGMADRVATFGQVLGELVSGSSKPARGAAAKPKRNRAAMAKRRFDLGAARFAR